MSENTYQQRKQQILTEVAATRLRALDGGFRTRSGAEQCRDSIQVPQSTLKYVGIGVAALVGVKLVASLLHRSSRTKGEAPRSQTRSIVKLLSVQLGSLVVIPVVKDVLKSMLREVLAGRSVTGAFDRWRPSRIFFRLVGLEK